MKNPKIPYKMLVGMRNKNKMREERLINRVRPG